jgi:outer membrane biosynthesis protein TonB
MIPQSQPKKKKNSSKVNLTISAVVHGIIILALIYFAAREGYLGKKIKEITVYKVEKEKPPEKPPEKKPEPPKEQPKPVEQPKVAEAPKPTAAPPTAAPPVVAPPSADVPSFDFEGGKAVNSESDPVQLYKGYLEYTLRSKWNRPDNLPDDNYVAEVAVNVDQQGNLRQTQWLKGSGDSQWDASVKKVFKLVQNIDRRPPTNFPPNVTIRFDVQEETEPVLTP